MLIYFLVNISYSFGLKNIPIVDIFLLSLGFILRVFYGATVIDVNVSYWLYFTVLSMSFYLGLGKRRNEIDKSIDSRKVLRQYNRNFLDKNMYMCLSLTIMFYSLWCVDSSTVQRFENYNYLLLTIPIVMLIVMRYSLDIEGDSFGDPVDVVLSDKIILILLVIFVLSMFLSLYILPSINFYF